MHVHMCKEKDSIAQADDIANHDGNPTPTYITKHYKTHTCTHTHTQYIYYIQVARREQNALAIHVCLSILTTPILVFNKCSYIAISIS